MTERQIRRHPSTVLRVLFEHPASGERAEAAAWDASLGGMFLETSSPLDVGSLIALEIETSAAKVFADARVLWTRANDEGEGRPAGMAVRFLDLPDEVAVALNRALQLALPQERTILGIGGATSEPTHPGIAPEPTPAIPLIVPRREERATQVGVAPPANAPVTVAKAAGAKPRAAEATEPSESPARKPSRIATDSDPPRKSGVGGRLFLLALIGGGAFAAYLYRDTIAQMLAPPSTVAVTETAPPPPSASALVLPVAASAPVPSSDLAVPATVSDAAIGDAAIGDAAVSDAGHHKDAGHDKDAGHPRDAGVHDAGRGKADAGHAPPKHP